MLHYVQELGPYFGCLPSYAGKVVVPWVLGSCFFFTLKKEVPCHVWKQMKVVRFDYNSKTASQKKIKTMARKMLESSEEIKENDFWIP